MEITYLGHSCFKLKGKSATVVIDPFDPKMVGLGLAKVSAEIVVVTHDHQDHNAIDKVSGTTGRPQPLVIKAPGEYEAEGVSVFGMSTYHDNKEGVERGRNTIYRIHIDGVVVAHLGDLGHKLSDKQVADLGDVDVLLVPVGGEFTIDPAAAGEVVEQIEPAMVVPMHYKAEGMAATFDGLAPVETFLKQVGAEAAERQTKLVINEDSLPEEREVVVLERG